MIERFLLGGLLVAIVALVIVATPIGQVLGIMAFIVGGLGLGDPLFAGVMQGLFFAPYVVSGVFVAFVIVDRVAQD